jgi:hypothetical protein
MHKGLRTNKLCGFWSGSELYQGLTTNAKIYTHIDLWLGIVFRLDAVHHHIVEENYISSQRTSVASCSLCCS